MTNAAESLGFVVSVLADLKYDAVGVGSMDLRFADKFFKETADNKLTVLDCSPTPGPSSVPYVVKRVDGVRVGIVSFTGPGAERAGNDYEVRKARYVAYKTARDESDILILLDQAGVADKSWLERNGARLGVPDVIVSGTTNAGMIQEQVIGSTRIVPTSMQGRTIGVVDIELSQGQDPRFAVRKINLDESVPEDQAIVKRVAEFMTKIRQQPSAVAAITQSGTQPGHTPPPVTNRPYYPPKLCKSCHQGQYNDWAQSKHAIAIETLVSRNKAVPECLICHSEMYRSVQRVSVPEAGVGGVECASCHAGSLPHGAERRTASMKSKVDPVSCLVCHTKDRSPDYDEQAYFSKVAHTGANTNATASALKPPTP